MTRRLGSSQGCACVLGVSASGAVAVTAAVLGGCSTGQWTPRYHQTRALVVPSPGDEVSIRADARFGSLDLAAHGRPAPDWEDLDALLPAAGAGEVAVLAILRSDREDRLPLAEVRPVWSDRTLTLGVDWPGKRRDHEGVEWVVRVPSVGAVSGDFDFGDVVVIEPLGAVDLDADFGDVTIERAHAAVRIAADFGDVGVSLSDDNPGPVWIVSDYGDVRLDAGRAFTGRLDMKTDFGDARLSQPVAGRRMRSSDSLTANLGEGPASRIEADFGDVDVTIRQ